MQSKIWAAGIFKLAVKRQVPPSAQAVSSTTWPGDKGLLPGDHIRKCQDWMQPLFLAEFLVSLGGVLLPTCEP